MGLSDIHFTHGNNRSVRKGDALSNSYSRWGWVCLVDCDDKHKVIKSKDWEKHQENQSCYLISMSKVHSDHAWRKYFSIKIINIIQQQPLEMSFRTSKSSFKVWLKIFSVASKLSLLKQWRWGSGREGRREVGKSGQRKGGKKPPLSEVTKDPAQSFYCMPFLSPTLSQNQYLLG